jgi:hypothetical protein
MRGMAGGLMGGMLGSMLLSGNAGAGSGTAGGTVSASACLISFSWREDVISFTGLSKLFAVRGS